MEALTFEQRLSHSRSRTREINPIAKTAKGAMVLLVSPTQAWYRPLKFSPHLSVFAFSSLVKRLYEQSGISNRSEDS